MSKKRSHVLDQIFFAAIKVDPDMALVKAEDIIRECGLKSIYSVRLFQINSNAFSQTKQLRFDFFLY
jgi:hypothetical protein